MPQECFYYRLKNFPHVKLVAKLTPAPKTVTTLVFGLIHQARHVLESIGATTSASSNERLTLFLPFADTTHIGRLNALAKQLVFGPIEALTFFATVGELDLFASRTRNVRCRLLSTHTARIVLKGISKCLVLGLIK